MNLRILDIIEILDEKPLHQSYADLSSLSSRTHNASASFFNLLGIAIAAIGTGPEL